MLAAPTASQLTARYPVFGSVPPTTLDAVLAETPGAVDETWIVTDQLPAMLAYAAHMLAAEGYGIGSVEVGGQTLDVSGPLKTVKVGDVQVGFGDPTIASGSGAFASGSDLSSSPYGRRYLELLRRSHPAVLVA